MSERPFPTRPHYLQSLRGLHRLHELAVAGQAESPEADAVCDGLEQPWNLLSEIEKKRITGLSEDLYSISSTPEPTLPESPQSRRKLTEFFEAREAGEWDQALEILRLWRRYVEPDRLSDLRGAIWRDAGDPDTAALFFQHAARLNRSTPLGT